MVQCEYKKCRFRSICNHAIPHERGCTCAVGCGAFGSKALCQEVEQKESLFSSNPMVTTDRKEGDGQLEPVTL